jgi:hypothetical protein
MYKSGLGHSFFCLHIENIYEKKLMCFYVN